MQSKNSYLNLTEKQLRIGGYLFVTVFFMIFFMMEMYFSSWHIPYLSFKIVAVSVPYTLAIWEPTRWLMLGLQQRWHGVQHLWKRLLLAVAILLPYGCLISYLRILIENSTSIWGMELTMLWYFMWATGTSLLFISLQIIMYECYYFFQEWVKAFSEKEALKQLQVDMQFESLKVQMQPHFLFNSLNSLVALIEFNPQRARQYAQELSHVYRYFLQASDRPMIGLQEELSFAYTYYLLLKTRYEEGLYLTIKNNPPAEAYELPPLSLQLLLENAIKHNVITRNRPLFIEILFDYEDEVIVVKNNMQRRPQLIKSGKGLLHLARRYELTGLPAIFIHEDVTGNEFSVTISFKKMLDYASAYN